MHYVNVHFTYLLTYLLVETQESSCDVLVVCGKTYPCPEAKNRGLDRGFAFWVSDGSLPVCIAGIFCIPF